MQQKIKVGFDISQLAHPGGVATYTARIAEKLQNSAELETHLFYSSLRKPYHGNLKLVKEVKIPPTLLEFLFNQVRFPSVDLFLGQLDIFHSSDWTQPKSKAKKVTTYHDVIPLKFPEWSTPKIVAVHKRRLELVKKEIDMVIAVSESTKKDLMEFNIPEDKITVVYEAAAPQFQPQDPKVVLQFRQKYKLPDQYILAMGGVGERKNIARIKEASQGYNLVIPGDTIPWVLPEELPLLYAAASVLLYPSLYEGFGLPVLEAMSCGLPVITSQGSSLPEVGGVAALFVDPENVNEMKEKIKLVMSDQTIRKVMIKNGLDQAKKFSWEKAAEQTIAVYKGLMK